MTRLTITLSAAGELRVDGPIDDRFLCYALLEAAKDVLREHWARQAQAGKIQTAGAGALAGLDGLRRGQS
jgi:hypothetical protein